MTSAAEQIRGGEVTKPLASSNVLPTMAYIHRQDESLWLGKTKVVSERRGIQEKKVRGAKRTKLAWRSSSRLNKIIEGK